MVMLGNVLPLWDTVLALIKLGAVIVPTTPLLNASDLADRIARGRVRHVVCAADCISRFDHVGKHCTRIVVGGPAPGWHAYEDGSTASPRFEPDGETSATDPMQLYFTSGTTSKPKLVMHTHVTYPIGHLSTMYWIGLRPGVIHCNSSSPGWANHAGAAFSRPGTLRPRYSFQIRPASTRRGCSSLSPEQGSPLSALLPRCGGCWSPNSSGITKRSCANW